MKVESSSIAMSSAHSESSYVFKESVTMEAAKSQDAVGAILTLSRLEGGKSVKDAMVEYQEEEQREQKQRQKENEARFAQSMAEQLRTLKANNQYEVSDELDMKIKMLKRILAMLSGREIPEDCKDVSSTKGNTLDLRSERYKEKIESSFSLDTGSIIRLDSGSNVVGTTSSGTTWQRITATSGFACEAESTSFASKGIVKTADGRSIDFNIELSMSRAFMSSIDTLEYQEYIKTDPLIINLDSDIASVTDQKFYFDLDSDGEEEQISFAGAGSGFLALDRNGDGKINDGSELFGTKSGDGFRDLVAFDEDGNGWIDENDDIFRRLRVWTRDENGQDYLIDLQSADVGAIYLGNVDTQFSLKDDDNTLKAQIMKTGIYLRESSGEVATINHVDLAI